MFGLCAVVPVAFHTKFATAQLTCCRCSRSFFNLAMPTSEVTTVAVYLWLGNWFIPAIS
jgi:hypothetical protein